jgi:hypothetical protein
MKMNGIGLNKNEKTGEDFKTPVQTATRLGASDVGIISIFYSSFECKVSGVPPKADSGYAIASIFPDT